MNSTRHERYFSILEKIAKDILPTVSTRLSACIVIKNNIISFGINSMKSNPFQAKFCSKNPQSIFFHAESNAIKNALKKIQVNDLKKSTLYIMRVKWDSPQIHKRKLIPALAKPCNGCWHAIKLFNIRKVIYTNGEKDFYSIEDVYAKNSAYFQRRFRNFI